MGMSNLPMLKAFLFPGTENLLSFTEIRNEMDQGSGGGRGGVAATAGRN